MIARSLFIAALLPALPALADGVGKDSIEAAGTSFPAIVAGTGAPVVYVHGMLGDDRAWAGYADATAASGHRFIAYTQRGFGPGSTADMPFSRDTNIADLTAILEAVGEPVDLVAWSYGGAVALAAAAAAPERVRRMVLYEPWIEEMLPHGTPEQQAAADALSAAVGPIAEAMAEGDVAVAGRAATEAFLGLGPDGFAEEPEEVQAMQRDNAGNFAAAWNAPSPTAISCEQLGKVRAPTLVVARSATLPAFAEMAKVVAACVPGATTATMEGQGHGGPLFARAAFEALALDFASGPS